MVVLTWLSVKSVVLKFPKDLYSGVKLESITSNGVSFQLLLFHSMLQSVTTCGFCFGLV